MSPRANIHVVETENSVALPETIVRPGSLGCVMGIVLYSELVRCTSPTAEKTSGLPVINPSPPLVRVTLASLEECNILLQNGLDFYGATFFPTEAAVSMSGVRTSGKKSIVGNRYSNGDSYHEHSDVVEP
jgi:hypothetical protein